MTKGHFSDFFCKKNILLIGLGLQGGGTGVARFLSDQNAKITIYDDKRSEDLASSVESLRNFKNISFVFGGDGQTTSGVFDFVIKGPSVKWSHPQVESHSSQNIPVYLEVALFQKMAPCRTIGVTGTRGKSTTTTMIFDVLTNLYTKGRVYKAGNLPGTCSLALLDEVTEDDIVVLELSSWQLSGFHKENVSPDIAVITSLFEDHLNFYDNFREYIYDKTAIYAYQSVSDHLIISALCAETFFQVATRPESQVKVVDPKSFFRNLRYLKGSHNISNASLALRTCEVILGIEAEDRIAQIISESKPLNCRQEVVGTWGNITFVNDSTSTTPVATITAINTFGDKDMVLLLGGNTKNLSTSELIETLSKYAGRIMGIVLLSGSFTDEISEILTDKFQDKVLGPLGSLEEAVKYAVDISVKKEGKVNIILSPGATSFAEFRNEFHRGREFERIVSDIIK